MLKVAHEEWALAPEPPRVRLEKESQGRLRWLTKEEAARLLDACRKSRNADLLYLVAGQAILSNQDRGGSVGVV